MAEVYTTILKYTIYIAGYIHTFLRWEIHIKRGAHHHLQLTKNSGEIHGYNELKKKGGLLYVALLQILFFKYYLSILITKGESKSFLVKRMQISRWLFLFSIMYTTPKPIHSQAFSSSFAFFYARLRKTKIFATPNRSQKELKRVIWLY